MGMGAMTGTVNRQDAGLLASAVAGDEIAFRRIIAAHHEDMRRICRAIAGEDALADEAVQAAWLVAWRKLGKVRGPAQLRFGSSRSRSGSQAAPAKRRGEPVEVTRSFTDAGGPDSVTDATALDLRAALARLGSDDAALLALRYVAGFDSNELAFATGISPSGTRSRIERLLKRATERTWAMTDMNGFERRVASELVRRAGPVRPVDDLAVFDAITAADRSPRWKFWSRPTPSAKGYPTAITGRSSVMFSPVKAIVAGALTFALLGVLSIAQPFGQQGTTVPGAPVTSSSPAATVAPEAGPALPSATRVTGTEVVSDMVSGPITTVDGIRQMRGLTATSTDTMDDPRVSGTGPIISNCTSTVTSGHSGAPTGSRTPTAPGRAPGAAPIWSRGGGTEHTMWLTGSGAYEGLTYYAHVNSSLRIEGIIFPGEAPAP